MLAECKKHSPSFNRLLAIHEEKPVCANRSLETFLTLPMHRVPGYIITLHRLLAFTPPDHVDRKSLEHARGVLEELSLVGSVHTFIHYTRDDASVHEILHYFIARMNQFI